MRIGIDIDGVLAQFDPPFAELLTFLTNRPCNVGEPDQWEWPRQHGFSEKEEAAAWDYITAHPTWWATLERYPDAFADLRALEAAGWDLYFITARRTPYVKDISAAWLKRVYGLQHPTVLLASQKGLIAKALRLNAFIDDRADMAINVKIMSSRTRSYLRRRPHNALAQPYAERDGIILIDSFQDFVKAELGHLTNQ